MAGRRGIRQAVGGVDSARAVRVCHVRKRYLFVRLLYHAVVVAAFAASAFPYPPLTLMLVARRPWQQGWSCAAGRWRPWETGFAASKLDASRAAWKRRARTRMSGTRLSRACVDGSRRAFRPWRATDCDRLDHSGSVDRAARPLGRTASRGQLPGRVAGVRGTHLAARSRPLLRRSLQSLKAVSNLETHVPAVSAMLFCRHARFQLRE